MSSSVDINKLKQQIISECPIFDALHAEVSNVIVGNEDILTNIIIAILCNGHILLEGVPGVAKTTMIKTMADALSLNFQRIQFTPDLLPSDLIGTLIYNTKTQDFETKKGPIFANLVLADEINRAPAKVQSALLEAMQEQQVTIGSNTYQLDKPFFVFATQNPIEQEGTYSLPEAQIDRFMFKILVKYPTEEQEKIIIRKSGKPTVIKEILDAKAICEYQDLVKKVYVDQNIIDYIVNIVFATRMPEKFSLTQLKQYIQYGVSPRAGIALHHAAQAHAFLQRRSFVTPEDVRAIAMPVLRHRLLLSYEAEIDAVIPDDIIASILAAVPTP